MLSQAFYEKAVRPAVLVPHAAALVGEGSEVLGYDTERSRDHAWGPRVTVFVDAQHVHDVSAALEDRLPDRYEDWPVRFFSWQSGTTRHHVDVVTLDDWLPAQIGVDPRSGLALLTWLTIPQQHLLQVTAGGVWNDDTGTLTAARALLEWYPQDVWLWLMASQWRLVGTLEPQIGRMAELGDERGSRIASARLAHLLMGLCFLQERQYWPYPKWFGTAFARLNAAADIGPLIDSSLQPIASLIASVPGLRRLLLSPSGTTCFASRPTFQPPPGPLRSASTTRCDRTTCSTPGASSGLAPPSSRTRTYGLCYPSDQ